MNSNAFQLPQPRLTNFERAALEPEERAVLQRMRPHLMLIGAPVQTRRALNDLRPAFREPLLVSPPAGRLVLVDLPRLGTLILEEVAVLSGDEQRRLADWLPHVRGCIQVVSTNSRPLLPLVERQCFLPHLYYRLNLLYVTLSG